MKIIFTCRVAPADDNDRIKSQFDDHDVLFSSQRDIKKQCYKMASSRLIEYV